MRHLILLLFFSVLGIGIIWGQDPVLSQYFNAPLINNPALASYGKKSMHVYSNYRQQWVGPGSSYNTMLASITGKVLKGYLSENDVLGVGGMVMSDVSLGGAFKSTYASASLAYLLSIDQEGASKIGVGLAGIYGSRRIDFSSLTFSSQFSSHGFNTTLPTGESALAAMNDYFSISAGMLFTHKKENAQVILGAAGYHFNTPRQTNISDVYEQLPTRYVVHASVDYILTSRLSIELNSLFQSQASTNYFMNGLIARYYPNLSQEDATNLAVGVFYRNTKTIVPYVGITRKSFQLSLTYDVNMLSSGVFSNAMKSWELGMSFGIK